MVMAARLAVFTGTLQMMRPNVLTAGCCSTRDQRVQSTAKNNDMQASAQR